uniref:Uncharacterized protein n=1 Tax=Electrophorus electricus TaxID=8005 RepID=A0A4W4EGG6_ELEEL
FASVVFERKLIKSPKVKRCAWCRWADIMALTGRLIDLAVIRKCEEVTITCNFQPKNPENRLIIISWTGEPDGSFDDEGVSVETQMVSADHSEGEQAHKMPGSDSR